MENSFNMETSNVTLDDLDRIMAILEENKENVPPNGRIGTWDEFTTTSSPSFVVWPEDIGFDTLPLPIAHLPLEPIPVSLIDEEINSTSKSTSSEEEEIIPQYEDISPPPGTSTPITSNHCLAVSPRKQDIFDLVLQLVQSNDEKGLENQLKLIPALVRKRNDQGKTIAMAALDQGNHSCLLMALQHGASNNDLDLVGNTLQHQAAKKGDAVAVILIHSALSPDYKQTNLFGEPIMFSAVESANDHVIKLVTEYTNDWNFLTNHATMTGFTLLHYAVVEKKEELVEKICQKMKGKRTQKSISEKMTPLHLACRSNNLKCCQLLYKLDPDQLYEADSEGKLPIHEIGNMDLLHFFLNEKPMMLTAMNYKTGRQLIHYAAEKQIAELIICLIQCTPPLNIRDEEGNRWEDLVSRDTKRKVIMGSAGYTE